MCDWPPTKGNTQNIRYDFGVVVNDVAASNRAGCGHCDHCSTSTSICIDRAVRCSREVRLPAAGCSRRLLQTALLCQGPVRGGVDQTECRGTNLWSVVLCVHLSQCRRRTECRGLVSGIFGHPLLIIIISMFCCRWRIWNRDGKTCVGGLVWQSSWQPSGGPKSSKCTQSDTDTTTHCSTSQK